ncbi:hypothetical protein H5410_061595 [Solanum commersonii]|uniref:Uncharacterized protein n=1 Tax=Solanum commersonii TaxID=4109 RepID=A0A9J5W8A6_SOLCO|nr:hypothetical protein H5410_061595 [Solanum commersonii]
MDHCMSLEETSAFPSTTSAAKGDKDSSITVTLIQKFIAHKLNLNDHTEVDVVCCDEKLNGDMKEAMI